LKFLIASAKLVHLLVAHFNLSVNKYLSCNWACKQILHLILF